MQFARLAVLALLALLACVSVQASQPVQAKHDGPLVDPLASPLLASGSGSGYTPGSSFIGAFDSVPLNPTHHLKRSLEEDRKYVAAILRAPLDLGDPANCKHSDLERDERELRKLALRINHRRISLQQQDQWIRSATEGLARIESEITSTHDTAKNLARQLDSLEAQKKDLTNHIRRNFLLKEWDAQSSTLMRLKDRRLKDEVSLQKKHNEFALRNHEHNQVLTKLHNMRSKQGLALGLLDDPKPYRFAQQGMEAASEEAAEQEQEQAAEAEIEQGSEAEAEAEQSTEAEAESQTEEAATSEEAQ
jgi:peptidoglycan hydrolase CwlO-like protein